MAGCDTLSLTPEGTLLQPCWPLVCRLKTQSLITCSYSTATGAVLCSVRNEACVTLQILRGPKWIAESRLSLATSQMALYRSKRCFRLRPSRRILFPQSGLIPMGHFVGSVSPCPCNLLLVLSDCIAMRTDTLLVSAVR